MMKAWHQEREQPQRPATTPQWLSPAFVLFSFLLFVALCDDLFLSNRLLSMVMKPNPFTTQDIERTAPEFRGDLPHLLVFNGERFEVYNLVKKDVQSYYATEVQPQCARCVKIIPLLVHALMELDPARFQPGQPVFQVLFSASDYAQAACKDNGCDVAKFAPLLMFGSVSNNSSDLPQVREAPNWFYLACLYDYKIKGKKKCAWTESGSLRTPFEKLDPTLIYRGSDFCFLPDHEELKLKPADTIDLTNVTSREETVETLMSHWEELFPRWRAIALSAEAELHSNGTSPPWIDAKFTNVFGEKVHKNFAQHGVQVSTKERMIPHWMSRYKYQIDLGGGGGTSWRGTLTKLSFPGVLFHHETPNKDWFYDEMQPWVHYIPVAWHLGDLKEKHEWAVTHEDEARLIAQNATQLFDYMMGESYMKKVYNEFFVEYLGEIIKAHITPTESWKELQKLYEADGFRLDRVSYCGDEFCTTRRRFGGKETYSFASPALSTH